MHPRHRDAHSHCAHVATTRNPHAGATSACAPHALPASQGKYVPVSYPERPADATAQLPNTTTTAHQHFSPPHRAATLRKPQHFTPCTSPRAQYVPIYHHAPLHPDTLAGPLAMPCEPHLRARKPMLRYWHHTTRLVSPAQPPLPAPPLTHFHILRPTTPMPRRPRRLTNAPASQRRTARTNHHAPGKSHAATMPRPTTDTPPGPAATNTTPHQPCRPAAPTRRTPTPGPVQPLPICLQMVGSGKVLLTFSL